MKPGTNVIWMQQLSGHKEKPVKAKVLGTTDKSHLIKILGRNEVKFVRKYNVMRGGK